MRLTNFWRLQKLSWLSLISPHEVSLAIYKGALEIMAGYMDVNPTFRSMVLERLRQYDKSQGEEQVSSELRRRFKAKLNFEH